MPFVVPAVRFSQKGITMYLAALTLEQLDMCNIDRWDPRRIGKWKGYQRGTIPAKVRNLAQYLERPDGILPVAGLLNVRTTNALRFSAPRTRQPRTGKLTIPDDTALWVVDMQHRLEGIRTAHSRGLLRQFPVPVLITESLQQIDEAAQFYIINTQAKKMNVDLTRRLLIEHNRIQHLANVPRWQLKAVNMAIKLNTRIRSNPWFGRIREPESERMREHVATEKSFVPSLTWLLNAPATRDKPVAHLSHFLAEYWEGIRANLPGAFESPRSHLIQKTPGMYAFHRLAPIVYRRYRSRSLATYKRVFRPLSGKARFGQRFWSTKNRRGARRYGTGAGAYARLASDLARHLHI